MYMYMYIRWERNVAAVGCHFYSYVNKYKIATSLKPG